MTMTNLRAISVLIAAMLILQLSQSLLGVQLPLAMEADALSRTEQGLVAAAYSAGFMGGAYVGLRLLSRVGHIRVFAACGALASAGGLMLFAADHVLVWLVVRAAMGAALALMFAAAESWMNAVLTVEGRGSAISAYHVAAKIALASGAFLAFGSGPTSPEPFMVAAALMALAIVPICLTTTQPPQPPKSEPLDVAALFRLAPAAVTASLVAGLMNTGVLALAPIYSMELFGPQAAIVFFAAGWIGSLFLQWPAGWLSDRMDRRLVIAALAGLAAVSAVALGAFGADMGFAWSCATFAMWGAGALSFHGVAVAHMADRAAPEQLARATSGMLFIWAGGSIAGPVIMGVAVDVFGVPSIFFTAALGMTVLVGAMLWRRTARKAPPAEAKTNFQNPPITSAAGAEMAFRQDPGDDRPPDDRPPESPASGPTVARP